MALDAFREAWPRSRPRPQIFKLQPPYVAKRRFQDPGSSREYRILKVSLKKNDTGTGKETALEPTSAGKIIQFRKKNHSNTSWFLFSCIPARLKYSPPLHMLYL